ncbi:MAG: TIGR01777 family oxidoreductase [Oceanicoccus sp.]
MTGTRSNNILITGASGMIGSALAARLRAAGYTVYQLDRNSTKAPFHYLQDSNRVVLDADIPLYAVINLAGPSIADKRWTETRKQIILQNRERLTSALAEALASAPTKPELFLSASAIGFYGEGSDVTADESSPTGTDFLASVAQRWEQATAPAERAGINTIHLRLGVVLSPDGGMLKQLLLPFKLGLGGPIGNGKQFLSWISITDVLNIICFLLENKPIVNALNLVAEQPVTNRQFSAALSSHLNRPDFLAIPTPVIKLLFGEMGEVLLLGSSRVRSSELADLGIKLQNPTLDSAFQSIIPS